MNTRLLRKSVLLFSILMMAAAATAQELTVTVNNDAPVFLIGKGLEYLEDPGGRLTLDDVSSPEAGRRFRKSANAVLNLGYTNSYYWTRFSIRNPGPGRDIRLLEIGYPLLDYLEIYIRQSGGQVLSSIAGDSLPFNRRELRYRNFIFKVPVEPGASTSIYLRTRTSSSHQLPLALWTQQAFFEKTINEQFMLGIFYGTMCVMILYNLFIFFTIRDRNYIFYVLHVLSFSLLFLSLDGYGFEYLWPGAVKWANICVPFFINNVSLWGMLFGQSYNKTRQSTPRLHRFMTVITSLAFVNILISLFVDNINITTRSAIILSIFVCLSLIISSTTSWYRGYKPARYFVIAIMVLLVGTMTHAFFVMGIIPNNIITSNSMSIGLTLDVLLFSFALADRINIERREKSEAQQLALENEQLARLAQAEALENMKKVDLLKDEFLSKTSHELRTPLNGIIGISESLINGATGPLPEETVQNLTMIVSSGRRLSSLVNDILDFSRIKNKDINLQLRAVDIREIANIVVFLSVPLVRNKPVTITNEMPEDLPLVFGDENRLQQVFHNLIGNSIKFTREGSITVSASRNDGMVTVTVTDTGPGIPKEKHDDIFKSFEQADSSIEREYGGTGLGLTISKQLVELHGGTIWVESEQGSGSSFYFTVPIAGSQSYGETASPRITVQETASTETPEFARIGSSTDHRDFITCNDVDIRHWAGLKNSRILVVDDEPVNIRVIQNYLKIFGVTVLVAYSGMEALDLVKQNPDLVLLDVMMPRLNGYETARKIRESYPGDDLPIIFLTAKNQINDFVDGFSAGGNDYITKPFSKGELLTRMSFHINFKNAIFNRRHMLLIEQELDVARRIQYSSIPQHIPDFPGLQIAAKYMPMQRIGGDFYDFHTDFKNYIGFLISDVSGHGIPASLIASMLKIAFYIMKNDPDDPARMLGAINRILSGHMYRHFMTASYLYFDLEKQSMCFARAGHLPLLIASRTDRTISGYLPKGKAIGWVTDLNCQNEDIPVRKGDRILLYTDGITEALNENKEMFGTESFELFIKETLTLPVSEFVTVLHNRILDWGYPKNELQDDFTIVAIDIV